MRCAAPDPRPAARPPFPRAGLGTPHASGGRRRGASTRASPPAAPTMAPSRHARSTRPSHGAGRGPGGQRFARGVHWRSAPTCEWRGGECLIWSGARRRTPAAPTPCRPGRASTASSPTRRPLGRACLPPSRRTPCARACTADWTSCDRARVWLPLPSASGMAGNAMSGVRGAAQSTRQACGCGCAIRGRGRGLPKGRGRRAWRHGAAVCASSPDLQLQRMLQRAISATTGR